jgi:hypothetical protein
MRDLVRVFGIAKGLAALALCGSLHRFDRGWGLLPTNCGNGGNHWQGKDRAKDATHETADAARNEDGGS